MIRKIQVWNVRRTAEPQRPLVISGCTKLARDEHEVQHDKVGRAVHCLPCKE